MNTSYTQILSAMKNSPWLILPDHLAAIVDIVNRRLDGDKLIDDEIRVRMEAIRDDRDSSRTEVGGGVGIIPLYGPIFPKANMMTELSGATSLEQFSSELSSLINDPNVQSIVMDIDSPGGMADMVMEVGQQIYDAREQKPIYAVANTLAGSAALWLATQATHFYSTPSGKVGSLGAYAIHEDISIKDANEGRKISYISAGKHKVEGNPHEKLTDEARQHIQAHIDESYEQFVSAVARGRGITTDEVEANYGQGRVLSATMAQEVGMIDGVLSLDDVLGSLLVHHSQPAMVRSVLSNQMARLHSNVNMMGGKLEHAPEEHSEPGSGNPPEPRPNPDPKETLGGDTRRDTPPIERENLVAEVDPLVEIRSLLKLDEDADVLAAVTTMHEELEPLRNAHAEVDKQREFKTLYPEQAKRLERLEASTRENEANAFAENLANARIMVTVKDGDDLVPTKTGFSAKVIEFAKEKHPIFAEGKGTAADMQEIFAAIANNGLVEYGETGSARGEELKEITAGGGGYSARHEFAAKISEIAEQDGLDFTAALTVASERYPELAEAYMTSHLAPGVK